MGHEKNTFPFLQSGSAEWRFPAWSTLPMDRPCDFPKFLSRTLSDSTSLHFHCMPRQPVDRNEHAIFRWSWRKKKQKNPEKLKTALTYSPLCPIPAVGLKYVKCLGAFAGEGWRKKNENFCNADVASRQFSTTAPSAPNTSGFRSCFFSRSWCSHEYRPNFQILSSASFDTRGSAHSWGYLRYLDGNFQTLQQVKNCRI